MEGWVGGDPAGKFLFYSPSVGLFHTVGGSIWLIQTPSSWLDFSKICRLFTMHLFIFAFFLACFVFFFSQSCCLGIAPPIGAVSFRL